MPLPSLLTNNKVENWFRRLESFLPYRRQELVLHPGLLVLSPVETRLGYFR